MSDESQIVVPPSFVALFIVPGRIKLSASRAEVAARYEFCEDLATMLNDPASSTLFELGVTESDVLLRIHRGLMSRDSGVDAKEAEWVTRRLAEQLNWQPPVFESSGSSNST